jgi:hypothetical protein
MFLSVCSRRSVINSTENLAANLFVGGRSDADTAGFGDPLKPGRNDDAVPEYIVVIDDDVADMDADAEFDPLVLRHGRIPFSQLCAKNQAKVQR